MNTDGVLNAVVLLFQRSSLVWAPTIAQLLEPFFFSLLAIAWVLMFLPIALGNHFGVFPGLINFFIGNGVALAFIRYGYEWIDGLFRGIVRMSEMMGLPPLNPSSLLAFGPKVSAPIAQSLADQGMLSFLTSPLTYLYGFAAVSISLSFAVLAAQLTAVLLLSFLLTAMCPFAFAFAGVSATRGLTFGYCRLVLGTLAGLFVILLMVAIITELASVMEQQLRTEFLIPGVSLGWEQYATVFMTGVVLIGLYIWIPQKVIRAVDGIAMDFAGGRMVAGYAGAVGTAAVSTASKVGQQAASAAQSATSKAIDYAKGSSGSGGGANQAQPLGVSPWGKKS